MSIDLPKGELEEFIEAANDAKGHRTSTDYFDRALEKLEMLSKAMEEESFADGVADLKKSFREISAELANKRYR